MLIYSHGFRTTMIVLKLYLHLSLSSSPSLVIVAGSDTTSGTLSNVVYSIVRHPDVYKQLQDEVDNFYPAGENALDSTFHSKMTYLEAVM